MTPSHYVMQNGENSLWCERAGGKVVSQHGKNN